MGVNIQQVAQAAGVSPATVSRVLNGNSQVRAELVLRVHEAVDRLGYRPHGPARSLRRQRSEIWVVVVPDIENAFFTSLVRGLEDAAHEAGLATAICNTDEDLDKERSYLEWAIAQRADGVVLAPADQERSDVSSLLRAAIPVVAVDRRLRSADLDTVLVDNVQGAREATAHLLAGGAARVACVTGPAAATTAEERARGWREALGSRADDELLVHADFRRDGGRAAVHELLGHHDRPDALFVANNLMTVGALDALAEAGVRLRDEMLLVGFDDMPWSTYMTPTLSCVAQPAIDVGRAAGELLRRRANDRLAPARTVTLPPTLHVRESSVPR